MRPIDGNEVPLLTAKQVVDGHAQGLGFGVQQRVFDGAERLGAQSVRSGSRGSRKGGIEALMVVYVVLSVPVVLALYTALRPTSGSLMAVYVGISVIGIVAFIVARPAFEMLSLSNGYAAAATDAERAAYLAAGTATYAAFHGTAFWVSYLIGSLGGLVLSAVILRGTIFSRRTAYVRIASSVFDFGLFVPGVGLLIALLSVVCLLAFNLMVARRLAQLARTSAASVRTLEQRALAI